MEFAILSSTFDFLNGNALLLKESTLGGNEEETQSTSGVVRDSVIEKLSVDEPGTYYLILFDVIVQSRRELVKAETHHVKSIVLDSLTITEEELKKHSKELKLPSDHIFQVKLTNSEGFPIVGRRFSIQRTLNAVSEMETDENGTITLFGRAEEYLMIAPFDQYTGERVSTIQFS